MSTVTYGRSANRAQTAASVSVSVIILAILFRIRAKTILDSSFLYGGGALPQAGNAFKSVWGDFPGPPVTFSGDRASPGGGFGVQTILVANRKGGVGKTMVSITLAAALAGR
ncbi:MAG: hypothetical protein AAF677_15950, partial [Pseudomonadota bacterium]